MNRPLHRIVRALYPDRFTARKSRRHIAAFSWKRLGLILASVFVLIKLVLLFLYYNTFISLQYDVEEAAAQVDTQLQRRKNIILNLSVMVMDYAKHEKEIFKHAADARKEMAELKRRPVLPPNQGKEAKVPAAAGDLDVLLSKIFAVAERYPELRLSENFRRYMDALVDAETKIAEQRMIYNERANDMSTAVGTFPGLVFAKLYGFEPPSFFEPEAEARKPPKVKY